MRLLVALRPCAAPALTHPNPPGIEKPPTQWTVRRRAGRVCRLVNNAYEGLGAVHDPTSLSQPGRPVNQGCTGRPGPHAGAISLGPRRRSAPHRPQIRLPEDMP